jgi:glucose-6-phosphate isomerase
MKPIDLEYYPILPSSIIIDAKEKIDTNKGNWDDPFFMDVYGHADLKEIKEVCKPFIEDSKIENIIIIGTGGSYQTMKALSLFATKNIHFLTSSRPQELSNVLSITKPDNSIVIPISRGGKTLDVNSVLSLFDEYKMLALSSQGPMKKLVEDLKATILPVPDLSGRFAASVCSVLFVPALLSGIDLDDFLKGLENGYETFKDLSDPENNLALVYATFLEQLYQKGYRNIFSMPYSEWLEGAVGLFVQEISESSGKEGTGIMGTYQPAPLCQHSVLELLLGGTKGHTTPILWTTMAEPQDVEIKSLDPTLDKKSALSVINYQLDATFQALLEQKIPAAKLSLQEVTINNLGKLIAFIQTTVYYYCLITNVNWSSNPLVNTGKKICNEAIEKNLDSKARIENRKIAAEKNFGNFFD